MASLSRFWASAFSISCERKRQAARGKSARGDERSAYLAHMAPEDDDREKATYRSAHPLAKEIFNLLRYASETDRRHVLIATRARVIKASSERAQLSLNAMKACLADEERFSRGIYDRWRARQPDPREWPSSQFLINTFGTWRRAMDAAGADVVGEVLTRRLLTTGKPFTREEVLICVKAYAESGGELKWDAYLAWAREQMQRLDRSLPRVVRSMACIQKLFGSWGELLTEAGLGEQYLAARQRYGGGNGRRHEYNAEQLAHWVAEAGRECGGAEMSIKAYDAWAQERMRCEMAESGRLVVIPSSQTVSRVVGSWAEALHRAGFLSEDEALTHRGRRARRVSDDELVAWVGLALSERGSDLPARRYDEWRLEYLRREGFRGTRPASAVFISKRLGGWRTARRLGKEWVASQADDDCPQTTPRVGSASGEAKGPSDQPGGHGRADG
jgi:hypothetical protein